MDRIDELTDYFVDNYFEGIFPMELWNHFLTTGEPRTNNHLEGYNLKLKNCVVSSHPDIFTAIKILLAIFIKNLIENIFIAIDKPKVAKVTESDDEDIFGDEGEDEFDESASETDDLITTVSQVLAFMYKCLQDQTMSLHKC